MTPQSETVYAQVAVSPPLKEPLTYRIPPSFADRVGVGMRVLVPLGKRRTTGFVVELRNHTYLPQLKEIIDVLDEIPVLDDHLLKLAFWASRYYLAPVGEVLASIFPPLLRDTGRRTVVVQSEGDEVNGLMEQKILAELQKGKKTTIKSLRRKFPGSVFYRALVSLERSGAVAIRDEVRKKGDPSRRRKADGEETPGSRGETANAMQLNPEQETAFAAIREKITHGGFAPFLLYGVTGSGKTEIYLRAMEEVKKLGRRSLILVPEISLTPQLLDRLKERFGARVGVLHSAMTPAQRSAQWWEVLNGKVDVVVGARSAIFAPVRDLGLIVVDEEHDSSYKQEEGFRYHGRDLAVVRARLAGCPVLLGSATPSLESFENGRRGRYWLLELRGRVAERTLPAVEILDLRERPEAAPETEGLTPRSLFSPGLIEALKRNYERNFQTLIFLNRRGFASFLQCRSCGRVARCSHCSVSLTYHRRERILLCHHCGFRRPTAELCSGCDRGAFAAVGFGTERLEQELRAILPEARVARMDRDTTGKRGSHERLIRQWQRGDLDVLVGTQMITKGHDVGGVTLVVSLLADHSLNLPDFRSAERTFQLLSQVAGRAGRGGEPGRVIIQTYMPDHYLFRHVAAHDYKAFFNAESEFRRALNYPPFGRLILLRLEGPKGRVVEEKARLLGEELRRLLASHERLDAEVLGPAPAPIARLRGRYRWQLLLKGEKSPRLAEMAREAAVKVAQTRSLRLHIDVDPYSML